MIGLRLLTALGHSPVALLALIRSPPGGFHGCTRTGAPSDAASSKNGSSSDSSRYFPLMLVAISTPSRPFSFTARRSSVAAASGLCSGTEASAQNRSGSSAVSSAIESFQRRAISSPGAGARS